ncbi:hypothetical protein [Bythopirellula polymerisocia]|uniref:hypothetical protein n=1 Tax=Bythopirellula polymerisocia TaxID=2528003 RepID=UPI0011B80F11|nr:hypothetical protein [Bythopirellula polymerisocia]
MPESTSPRCDKALRTQVEDITDGIDIFLSMAWPEGSPAQATPQTVAADNGTALRTSATRRCLAATRQHLLALSDMRTGAVVFREKIGLVLPANLDLLASPHVGNDLSEVFGSDFFIHRKAPIRAEWIA